MACGNQCAPRGTQRAPCCFKRACALDVHAACDTLSTFVCYMVLLILASSSKRSADCLAHPPAAQHAASQLTSQPAGAVRQAQHHMHRYARRLFAH